MKTCFQLNKTNKLKINFLFIYKTPGHGNKKK